MRRRCCFQVLALGAAVSTAALLGVWQTLSGRQTTTAGRSGPSCSALFKLPLRSSVAISNFLIHRASLRKGRHERCLPFDCHQALHSCKRTGASAELRMISCAKVSSRSPGALLGVQGIEL